MDILKNPKVAIIIVNWNGFNDTVKCLQSLFKISYNNYEVIIVDNGSSGTDVTQLKQLFKDRIFIIENKANLGFAVANNIGIKYCMKSPPDYFLLLNNDTEVDREFLNELIRVANYNSLIGLVGPKMYFFDPPNMLWFAGAKYNWLLGHFQRGDKKKDTGQFEVVTETDYIPGACMLIKLSVIKKIGGLPVEYFLGWEDIDYCLNARQNGYRCIYAPKSNIWHKLSASYKRGGMSKLQVSYGIRNRIIVRWKYLGTLQFFIFITFFISVISVIHFLVYAFLYKDTNRIRAYISGLRQGFSYISKVQKK